jgi:hypothetical protein
MSDKAAVGRETARRINTSVPNPARVYDYLAESGIRQFLDIGTGLPSANNVHEVAQAVAPAARIVYVDNDPVVMLHARALLTSTPQGVTEFLEADMREPERVLGEAAKTLDFGQPLAGRPRESRRSCRVNIASQGGHDIEARHPPAGQARPSGRDGLRNFHSKCRRLTGLL